MNKEDVKVLIIGKHEHRGEKKGINSTVTLIKTDKNVLVDTGSFLDRDRLVSRLKEEGLSPDDIDIVVLTHLHLDHMVNVDLFMNARIYCKFTGGDYPGQFHIPKEGCVVRFNIEDGVEITEHVKLLLTPGHTMDSISVLVETEDGKFIISGDAFANEEWINKEKQPNKMVVASVDEFNKSREKVLNIADYIVPGHGNMFKV
jgi:glyoxylase-like metal-dependent hydrolase (beta-lactamase superfamily II)